MTDIDSIYNQLWLNAAEKIAGGYYELDPLINSAEDTRRGITVLSYLKQDNSNVSRNIVEFIRRLASLEPEQYFYPESELHLTILSIIHCEENFSLSDIDIPSYKSVFELAIKNIGPIKINFRGVTASPGCIMVQGYPVNEQLEALREQLRASFGNSSLYTVMDHRYKLITAHSTIARFHMPLRNNQKLLDFLSDYRTYDFGMLELKDISLIFNGWYQHMSETKFLARYELNNSLYEYTKASN